MKQANQFNVRPRSEKEREVLKRWLDASASLWNETNYARRQAFLEDKASGMPTPAISKASARASSAVVSPSKSSAKTRKRGGRSSVVTRSATPGNPTTSRRHPDTGATKAMGEFSEPPSATTNTPSSTGTAPDSK
jgi:hypothetical protein